jgi:hypothetical protein
MELDFKKLVFFLGTRLKLLFIGLDQVSFSLDWIWSVFHRIGSGQFFIGLDLVSFSSDWIGSVFIGLVQVSFSLVWIWLFSQDTDYQFFMGLISLFSL